MTFKAFRGSAFNHSHENKAFNDLHDLLQQHWSERDEPLYLFGNFFVGGKELDALVIKRNAIIVIDFRAPRIMSNLQGLCGHEKAAEEAAEQENLISTIDEIS